jgi:hypothetical protein
MNLNRRDAETQSFNPQIAQISEAIICENQRDLRIRSFSQRLSASAVN